MALRIARKCGDLPVPFSAVAVALRHEMLRGQPRQLPHAIQILERVGESRTSLAVHHAPDGDLLPCLIAHGLDIVRSEIIGSAVFVHERVNIRIRNGVHLVHKLAHGPGIDLPAELDLCFDLIALCDGHLTHIVAEAHDLHVLRYRRTDRRLHPASQPRLHRLVPPVSRDHLARRTQPRADKAVLAVAVRRLIEIHEIHVDLFVRDLTIVLRGKMTPWLLQRSETIDPHFRRRERMTPRDDTGTFVVIVSLFDRISDFPGAFGRHFIYDGIRQSFGERLRHFLCARIYCCKHLRPIQALAADNKPEFVVFHIISVSLMHIPFTQKLRIAEKGHIRLQGLPRKETLFRV